ncbi:glycosylphosphatidylinositol anchor biosynthesis [Malassezia furfur]|uniref:Mannosyltransferase n=1 Tax=Malassezia furfur TaxID=55194 RepID=A0ABY8EQM7_MALFU|nr:glycosylphosphatidylinositol anchor biosynthesis [Malassezia furfur]
MGMLVSVACAVARALTAWGASRTFFQPDEYWQTLEIAHRIVFGYGYQTWEWIGVAPIRSAVHPLLFVPLYAALRWTGADTHGPWMVTLPAMQQTALATLGDAFFYALACRVAGLGTARVWAVLHTLSLYWTYTCARPLSNSTEAALLSIALYYWPLTARDVAHGSTASLILALFAAFAGILVRPTGLLVWAFLGAKALYDGAHTGGPRSIARLVSVAAVTGTAMGALGYAADTWYFQRPVFTFVHFFVENVMRSLSVFYGAHPWHWYLTQGLPGVLTVSLPWALRGWQKVLGLPHDSALWTLGALAVWTVGVFSLLSHKEARFLQPLVPLLHLFAACSLRPRGTTWRAAWTALPKVLRYALLAQVPILIYVLGFHAKGQIRVMQYVHDVATPRTTFGFLMPCHSTPWQSHMHARVLETTELDSGLVSGDVGRAWFLACPRHGTQILRRTGTSPTFSCTTQYATYATASPHAWTPRFRRCGPCISARPAAQTPPMWWPSTPPVTWAGGTLGHRTWSCTTPFCIRAHHKRSGIFWPSAGTKKWYVSGTRYGIQSRNAKGTLWYCGISMNGKRSWLIIQKRHKRRYHPWRDAISSTAAASNSSSPMSRVKLSSDSGLSWVSWETAGTVTGSLCTRANRGLGSGDVREVGASRDCAVEWPGSA